MDVTCPGATLALAMIYLKTNNRYCIPCGDGVTSFLTSLGTLNSLTVFISPVLDQPGFSAVKCKLYRFLSKNHTFCYFNDI